MCDMFAACVGGVACCCVSGVRVMPAVCVCVSVCLCVRPLLGGRNPTPEKVYVPKISLQFRAPRENFIYISEENFSDVNPERPPPLPPGGP